MNSRKVILSIVMLLFALCAQAQTTLSYNDLLSKANTQYARRQYKDALTNYNELLKQRPATSLLRYRKGRCLYELGYDNEAKSYLDTMASTYPITTLYLGLLERRQYHFDQAEQYIRNYLSENSNSEYKDMATDELKSTELGRQMLQKTQFVTSQWNKRIKRAVLETELRKSLRMGRWVKDRGVVSYENEPRTYRLEQRDTSLIVFKRVNDRWQRAKRWTISSYCNEVMPFITQDGKDIYFAQRGRQSIGEHDIFHAHYDSKTNSWSEPKNLGMPFNSPSNEVLFVADNGNKNGYLVTSRRCTAGEVLIYQFNLQENYARDLANDPLPFAALTSTHKPGATNGEGATATTNTNTTATTNNKPQQTTQTTAKPATTTTTTTTTKPTTTTQTTKTTQTTQTTAKPTTAKPSQPEFMFEINQDLTYYHQSDFRSPRALACFQTYLQQKKELRQKQDAINLDRETLSHAPEEAKSMLEQRILKDEQELLQLKLVILEQTEMIRQLELDTIEGRD